MNADVNAIIVGYNGRVDMFEAIGFIKQAEEPEMMTPELFDRMF